MGGFVPTLASHSFVAELGKTPGLHPFYWPNPRLGLPSGAPPPPHVCSFLMDQLSISCPLLPEPHTPQPTTASFILRTRAWANCSQSCLRHALTLTNPVSLNLPSFVPSLSVVPPSDSLATSIWYQYVALKLVTSWWYSVQRLMIQCTPSLVPGRMAHTLIYVNVSAIYYSDGRGNELRVKNSCFKGPRILNHTKQNFGLRKCSRLSSVLARLLRNHRKSLLL